MSSHFCLSVRFLDPVFHGRSDGSGREWPPSPLRVFQALLAAAARRESGKLSNKAQSAFEWLEARTEAPLVIAPIATEGNAYVLSVPNNAMDIVGRAWSKGNYSNSGDASPAKHRTLKTVRSTLLAGDATHYLWPLPDPVSEEVRAYIQTLCVSAASIVALGWGLDLVAGHGAIVSDEQLEGLIGERWLPGISEQGGGLRMPIHGTLDDLRNRHEGFLNRLGTDGLVPPPPLSAYGRTQYRRAVDTPTRPVAAFSLLRLDASGFRPFDAARRGLTLAGMMRSAVKAAAQRSGWEEAKIDSFVLGHGESKVSAAHVAVGPRRFAYLPLPSIESRKDRTGGVAGSVRRVIVTTFSSDCQDAVAWAKRAVSGVELRDDDTKEAVALLSLIPDRDNGVQRYLQQAATWATVTPMVLPGFDDPAHYRRRMKKPIGAEGQRILLERLDTRIDGLLRKAIVQAGFSQELADNALVEWRKVGFWPGSEPAERYGTPAHLKRFPTYHVKIRWRDAQLHAVEIPGPICLGGGRFYGLGLFAAM